MDSIIGTSGSSATDQRQATADLIKETDTARFAEDVIQASMTAPVIVDFWAPWCGPCKQLGPALEKTVRAAGGAVRMVKINVDENQGLAAQLRIQSIPAVYAFFQGQPVDGFVGAQTESEVKRFVDNLVHQSGAAPQESPIEQALEQAQAALEAKQYGAATALFGQILQHEPNNEAALAGMIRCYLDSGDQAGARKMLDSVPEELRAKPEIASVAAALELAEQSAQAGPVPELRARVAAGPDDHQARIDLALALHAAGDREAAVDELLESIRRDRAWNEEAARKQLVKLFDAWGATDPLTVQSRRRLSSLLFS
jgi:putative thioredoxin